MKIRKIILSVIAATFLFGCGSKSASTPTTSTAAETKEESTTNEYATYLTLSNDILDVAKKVVKETENILNGKTDIKTGCKTIESIYDESKSKSQTKADETSLGEIKTILMELTLCSEGIDTSTELINTCLDGLKQTIEYNEKN